MLVLRLIGILVLITIAGSLALYLFTRNRRYLHLCLAGVPVRLRVPAGLFMAFYVLERLVLVV